MATHYSEPQRVNAFVNSQSEDTVLPDNLQTRTKTVQKMCNTSDLAGIR